MRTVGATLLIIVAVLSACPAMADLVTGSWIQWDLNGHEYALTPISTWAESEATAVQWGGHLVTVNTALEDEWLNDTFGGVPHNTDPEYHFWIGFLTADHTGIWNWVSGESSTYTHWDPGEPNDSGWTYEDRAIMGYNYNFHLDGWVDIPGLDRFYGIVERPAVVPEPASVTLLGLGVLGLVVRGVRRLRSVS